MEYRNVVIEGDQLSGESRYTPESSWHSFSAVKDLFVINLALEVHGANDPDLYDRLWALQDGYGEAGFVPSQGWDWSGIRDSTPKARAEMYALASEFVTDDDLVDQLGVTFR